MKESKKKKQLKLLEKSIYIVGYALILVIMSMLFKNTIQIDNSFLGIWGLLISFVIYILNKTIKPVIIKLTIPITALTLGISYPFINVFILKIVDILFYNHFSVKGIFYPFLVAILISIMNIIMDEVIIKPAIRRENI